MILAKRPRRYDPPMQALPLSKRMPRVVYGESKPSDAKTYITCDSHVVPHRSTEQAQGCLTSEFGWDPVLSPWYERMMESIGVPRSLSAFRSKWMEAKGFKATRVVTLDALHSPIKYLTAGLSTEGTRPLANYQGTMFRFTLAVQLS